MVSGWQPDVLEREKINPILFINRVILNSPHSESSWFYLILFTTAALWLIIICVFSLANSKCLNLILERCSFKWLQTKEGKKLRQNISFWLPALKWRETGLTVKIQQNQDWRHFRNRTSQVVEYVCTSIRRRTQQRGLHKDSGEDVGVSCQPVEPRSSEQHEIFKVWQVMSFIL